MKLRYAMVCSSNHNRSLEAHNLLKKQRFDVSSYGTGTHVKIPGPSIQEPNIYDFRTPYKRNGILNMLKRNLWVKLAPQRWQDNVADGVFDIVFTFEEKIFDVVVEDDRPDYGSLYAILYGPYVLAGLSLGDHEIATGSPKSVSDWVTPVLADYNSHLISLSQETGNSRVFFSNKE
ncbi:hypothetical protein Drorol1_Dr00027815 [Drosera rotundifolia]